MKFKALITALVAFLAVAVAGTALAEDGKVKGPFWNAVHAAGSITYKDGSSQSYNWDRGKITALSSSSISIERRDKVALTFAIDASTLVRNDHASYTLADLKAGLRATIVSQNGTAVVIRHIRGDGAPSGNDPSQVQLPLSKSVYGDGTVLFADGTSQAVHYDRGQITAKDASSLTIKRPDGKSVTLTYDAQDARSGAGRGLLGRQARGRGARDVLLRERQGGPDPLRLEGEGCRLPAGPGPGRNRLQVTDCYLGSSCQTSSRRMGVALPSSARPSTSTSGPPTMKSVWIAETFRSSPGSPSMPTA